MKVLFFFFVTLSLVFAESEPPDELIFFPRDKEEQKELKKKFGDDLATNAKEKIKKFKLEVDFDVLSLKYFKFNNEVEVKELSSSEVFHDVTKKAYQGNVWTNLSFESDVAVPFAVTISTPNFPIGLNFELNRGIKGLYEINLPVKLQYTDNLSVFKTFFRNAFIKVEGISAARYPRSAKKILHSYEQGAELSYTGGRYLLVKAGLEYTNALSVENNIVALVESQIKQTVKILEKDSQRVLKLTYAKKNVRSFGLEQNAGVGINLFKAKSRLIDFNAELKLNFFSRYKLNKKNTEILYEYLYDLDYPGVEFAFNEAIKGNLLPTQEMAIHRYQKKYQGILINRQVTSELLTNIKEHVFGLIARDLSLENKLSDLKVMGDKDHIINLKKKSINIHEKVEDFNRYGETKKIETFLFDSLKDVNVLFGLVDNEEYFKIESSLTERKRINSQGGFENQTRPEIHYEYSKKIKSISDRNKDLFFQKAYRFAVWGNEDIREYLVNDHLRSFCDKDFVFKIKSIFFEEDIKKILNISETEFWSAFAKYVEDSNLNAYVDEVARQSRIKDYEVFLENVSPENKQYLIVQRNLKVLKQILREKVFLKIKKMSDYSVLYEKKIKPFHDFLSELHPESFHFLLALILENKDQETSESFHQISIAGSGDCEDDWYF